MNKRFRSYEELLKEKQQLEILLQAQKEVIRYDIQELKAKVQPIKDAFEFVKKITTKDKTSILLNIGSDIAINTVVKNFILSRAGWFTKLIIPYFLKNYSSHFLAEQRDKWLAKLKNWLGHKNGEEHGKEEEKWDEGADLRDDTE